MSEAWMLLESIPPSERIPIANEYITALGAVANTLAKSAYAAHAERVNGDPGEVYWRRGHCSHVSDLLGKALHEHQIDTRMREWHGTDLTSHHFLRKGVVLLDPTWQQFLPEPQPDAPKVLVTTADRLEQDVTELGVPQRWHKVWTHSNDSSRIVWP